MIQNQNRLSPEDEAKLGSYLLQVHDYVNQLRLLHKFFKFSALHIVEIFGSDPDVYDNLDTLLHLFFGDNEILLDEVNSKIQQARKLMQSQRDS
jgi:hypothetical protein